MLVLSSCVTNCSSNSNGKAGIFGDGASVNHSRAEGNGENGINAGLGVVSHCVGFSNDQVSGSWAQIYVLPGGQRDACVPAAE